jgi:hypothetical protein
MFGEWAPRYRHSCIYPPCILYIFLLLTPPVYSKNDGGVEMMTKMMSKEFWTEAEAEAEETAGFGVVLSLPSQ